MNYINEIRSMCSSNVKKLALFAALFTIFGMLFALDIILPIQHISRIGVAKEYVSYYTPAFLKGIKATVTDERPEEFNGVTRLEVRSVSASSSLDGEEYMPDKMIDGHTKTAWQEGDLSSEGEGESIRFKVDGRTISGITMHSGFWVNQKIYENNSRPKTIRISFGGGAFTVDLSDEMTEHFIYFSKPIRVTDIEITIKEVYPGSTGDCCISEIGFYGEILGENSN